MPSQPQATPQHSRSKRRRETESQGSDPAPRGSSGGDAESVSCVLPAAASQRPLTSVKKRKNSPNDSAAALSAKPSKTVPKSRNAGDADEPITLSDGDTSPVESDGDEGVSAVKASVRTAAQLAGAHSANGRRARFAQRYSGLTPEETLGT